MEPTNTEIMEGIERIEGKLDLVLEELAKETGETEDNPRSLDDGSTTKQRDESQPL